MSAATAPGPSPWLGRCFLHPVVDYLLIGGGLSLLWYAGLEAFTGDQIFTGGELLPVAILLANCTHFAASTVRLYTKPAAATTWPFVTMVLPLLMLVALSASIWAPERLGFHLFALYLTWSPYHYARQAYGLSLMYSVRSGCMLSEREKQGLLLTCLLPFFYSFLWAAGAGLDWMLPHDVIALGPVSAARESLLVALPWVIHAAPLLVFAAVWRRHGRPMPLISLLTVVTNGVWWTLFNYQEAFLWATVFHGIQYMAIVMVFHVKDHAAGLGEGRGALYHALWFYAVSLVVAYAIFQALPLFYVFVGFGRMESMMMVIAAINVHHFIVDAFIWRFSKGGSNRKVVQGAAAPA